MFQLKPTTNIFVIIDFPRNIEYSNQSFEKSNRFECFFPEFYLGFEDIKIILLNK